MSDTIDLTVLDDMRLAISPHEIGRDAEHNSATFKITQPAALDQYACRAEVRTTAGTTYRLVTNNEFDLTNDITVQGHGQIQLAYSDGTQVMKKTTLAPFHITESLNAVDPGAPGFGDGLAQMQDRAFADVGTVGTQLIFVNIGGREVARATFPGAGLDEITADGLYVRRDAGNSMDGSLVFSRANLGLIFDPLGIGAILYGDETGLRFRRGAGSGDITIEDSSGVLTTRSAVMTMSASDLRYLQLAGGPMPGTITFAAGQGFAFQPGSSAVQEQGGTLVARHGAGQFSGIITVNDGDARYLSQQGGNVNGTLQMLANNRIISAMGTGNNPMLCIGSNDTGFWRSGGTVIFEVGFAATWFHSGTTSTCNVPLNLTVAPTLAAHVTTKAYVDERRAPSVKFDIPVDFPLSATWQTLYTPTYQIPRGGISRVRVCVSASLRATAQGGLAAVGVSCHPGIPIDRIERHAFVYNLTGVTTGFAVEFTMDVSGTAPIFTIQVALLATNPPTNDVTIIGGDTFAQERSQILIHDLGPR